MTGLVRKAMLLSGGLLLVASAAMAGVPSAGNSTIGAGVNLGGTTGGVVDVRVEKSITVRDASNNPVQNSTVEIIFTVCTSADIRLCATQPFAGLAISCTGKSVAAITNASGVATFRIVGGANNPGGNSAGYSSTVTGCANVKADGVPLGNLVAGAFDQNTASGVNPVDLSAFLADRFGTYRGRSDYDGNFVVNPVDLSAFLGVRFGGGSTVSCASVCP